MPDSPAHQKPHRRRRKALFVLLALLLGLVVAALLLELGFRMFWQLPPEFAEFDQAGMYAATADGRPTLRAGYRGSLRIGDAAATSVHVNTLGMRGDEVPAPSPDRPRILVAGDSLVFGYGVEADEALPACLERQLQARGVAAVVGNGGVPTFGVGHAVEHMQHLDRRFDADTFVLCGFLGNDPLDAARPERVVYAGQMHLGNMARLIRGGSWRTRLALRSRAALWIERWILLNAPASSPLANVPPDAIVDARAAGLPPQLHASLFLDHRDSEHVFVPGTEPVIPRLLGYLRDALRQALEVAGDRPLVFVILPTSWHTNEQKRLTTLRQWQFDPATYEHGLLQRRWLAVARELGIPAYDATPVLTAAGDSSELFVNDGGHLSVRGNEVVGRWLAEHVAGHLK